MGIGIIGGYSNNNSNGALAINSNHIFGDSIARDSYFATNPTEKKNGTLVSVGAGYQEWDGSQWIDKTAIIGGGTSGSGSTFDKGDYNVTYEYDVQGRRIKETYFGDLNRVVQYTYVSAGLENEGKVLTYKITQDGQSTTQTFSYDSSGNIVSINSVLT